jgi:hypothetical protein
MFRKSLSIAAFAGIIAVSLWGWVPGASSESPLPVENQARYEPIQSITYEFGSKFMTGYFVERDATCVVTVMIIEKSDPEEPLGLSPTRVRLVLSPGQVAGLDSEEGRSVNFTCEAGAATLLVDVGERDQLVALQEAALKADIALRP